MSDCECVFRHDIQVDGYGETARCRFLEQVMGMPQSVINRVPRGACEACLRHAAEGMLVEHPVLSSLLYQNCDNTLNDPSFNKTICMADRSRLGRLLNAAEGALRIQSERRQPASFFPSCDVILCASEFSAELRQSIESALDQIDVAPFVHLIDTGASGTTFEAYRSHWSVRHYRMPPGTTLLAGLHSIIESLCSPFVAFQSVDAPSEPQRLIESIRTLSKRGAEIFATHSFGESPLSNSTFVDKTYRRRVSLATVVMRRATFVDMGGIADGFQDDDVEFFHRAVFERRQFAIGDQPLVRKATPEVLPCTDPPPHYPSLKTGTLRAFARGFPRVSTACDIVLPFHGQIDYVEESLKSLLEQQSADLVIHLIDDATAEETSGFLDKWSRHPNLRVYRNRENIGQFQSFNNVSQYFETDLAAVQDADDISLPHRISSAGQMLHYSGADFLGGAVELFGNDHVVEVNTQDATSPRHVLRDSIRRSFYLEDSKDDYFVENPTAVFRVAMFRAMGGFADFGDRLTNRTSLDTEFQLRCRFQGVRFALSREIVVRYRVHCESATQNRLTGWGTTPRKNAARQLVERCQLFRRGGFDVKSFGSLGRNSKITERL